MRFAYALVPLLVGAAWLAACSSSSSPSGASATDADASADATTPIEDAGGAPNDGNVDAGTPGSPGDASSPNEAGTTTTPNPPSAQAPTPYQLLGRFAPNGDGGFLAVWSGSGVHARFTGSSIAIDMASATSNEYEIVIDGVTTGVPLTVTAASRATVTLASALGTGTHDVIVFKRNEADKGSFVFYGLVPSTDGALVDSAPPFSHRIEFIGDSITAGFGDLGVTNCSDPDGIDEDGWLSHAALAARMLDADVHIVAFSGQGAYRNNLGATGPDAVLGTWFQYATAAYDTNGQLQPVALWDFSTWAADAVVINLGTNDFLTGDPGQPFIDAYVQLVELVRSKYPGVPIFMGVGPMLTGTNRTTLASDLSEVIATVSPDAATPSIQTVTYGTVSTTNCDGHPTVTDQRAMATTLATQVHAALGWAVDPSVQ